MVGRSISNAPFTCVWMCVRVCVCLFECEAGSFTCNYGVVCAWLWWSKLRGMFVECVHCCAARTYSLLCSLIWTLFHFADANSQITQMPFTMFFSGHFQEGTTKAWYKSSNNQPCMIYGLHRVHSIWSFDLRFFEESKSLETHTHTQAHTHQSTAEFQMHDRQRTTHVQMHKACLGARTPIQGHNRLFNLWSMLHRQIQAGSFPVHTTFCSTS